MEKIILERSKIPIHLLKYFKFKETKEIVTKSYISKLCDIFDEVKRVLRDDGTCFVNLGDTYYTKSGGKFENDTLSKKNKKEVSETTGINKANELRGRGILPEKSLCNIPARFSIEMQDRGWILRNVIILHKRNCMPSSIRDRFTVDFEYFFFFVKSRKYFFNQQKEPQKACSIRRAFSNNHLDIRKDKGKNEFAISSVSQDKCYSKLRENIKIGEVPMRNKRCVWDVTSKPFKGSHFATFSPEWIRPIVRCGCPVGGIILDPFFGAGTTGMVALQEKMNFVGIDLNQKYIEIAKERLKPYMEQKTLKDGDKA